MRLGFLVSLLAMFPLQMAPFRDSLWKLLFRQELQASCPAGCACHAAAELLLASADCYRGEQPDGLHRAWAAVAQ